MATEADALTSVKTVLDANWSAGNTNSITPTIYVTTNQALRLDMATANTHIILYLASHTTDPNDLGASHKERTVDRVSIDIRTKVSRAHLINCYNETRRIFSTRINNFDSSAFQQIMPIGFQDFSTPGFFRYVYDIYLKNWVVSR